MRVTFSFQRKKGKTKKQFLKKGKDESGGLYTEHFTRQIKTKKKS